MNIPELSVFPIGKPNDAFAEYFSGQLYGEWGAKHITGRDFMRKMDM